MPCWQVRWVSLGILVEPGPKLARSEEAFEESNAKYKHRELASPVTLLHFCLPEPVKTI